MKKKLLSLALVLAMALTLLPTAALAATYTATVALPSSAPTATVKTDNPNNADTIKVDWSLPTVKSDDATTAGAALPSESDVLQSVKVELSGTGLTAKDNGLTKTLAATATTATFTRNTDFETSSTTELTLTAKVTFTLKASVNVGEDAAANTFTITAFASGADNISKNDIKYTPSSSTVTPNITEKSASMTSATAATVVLTVKGYASGTDIKVTVTNKNSSSDKKEVTVATTKDTSATGTEDLTFNFTGLTSGATYTYVANDGSKDTAGTTELKYTEQGGNTKTITIKEASMPTATTAKVVFTVKGFGDQTSFTVTLTNKDDKTTKAGTAKTSGTSEQDLTVEISGLTSGATYTYKIEGGSVTQNGSTDLAYHNTETPTTPTTPETPKEEEKAPSTNAQGVPVASEVSTVKQANQAIDTLKKTNADTMADKLMTNDTAASSFASLDRTVASVKGIDTGVERKTGLPSVVNNGTVGVVGAALNASGSTVRLVVDVPSKSYTASAGYQVSMTMTGVSNAAKLAVPVIITLPLPSDVQAGRVVVLHYHSGSTPTVIIPSVSGNTLRFAVTGFSDFVITDYGDVEANGGSGFYTVVQGGGNRVDPNALDNATLAAIASLASGDVFTDVPATHWAADQIRWARNQNLMGGYEDGSFHPTAATTRQQLWMVLARMDGTFPATMADARAWAINTGVSDGSNPAGVLSRQQLVTMLYRFAQSKGKDVTASAALSAYTDGAKVAPYAKDALAWAAAKGIVTGSNGKLNPENTATRAHFAVFLSRYSATVI